MKYLATVEYCGKNYCGWQRQADSPTVQQVFEEALADLFGATIAVTASGRTDAGVHAYGQAVSFEATTNIPTAKLPFAINARLPQDIRVQSVREVPADFNARFSAKRKTYVYKAYVSKIDSPLKSGFYARITPPFSIKKARAAAVALVGKHDFKAFSASGSEVLTTTREIFNLKISGTKGEFTLEITGDGFLYNMVRIIAGTLIEIGAGRLPPDTVQTMLATGDRSLGGKTYPPEGLYLKSVEYGL